MQREVYSHPREQEGFCNHHFVQIEYQYLICHQPCISVTWESQICCWNYPWSQQTSEAKTKHEFSKELFYVNKLLQLHLQLIKHEFTYMYSFWAGIFVLFQ